MVSPPKCLNNKESNTSNTNDLILIPKDRSRESKEETAMENRITLQVSNLWTSKESSSVGMIQTIISINYWVVNIS